MNTASLRPEDILVRVQPTPNPSALKFITNQALKTEGKATFHSIHDCGSVKLVESVFAILGIKQVYLFQNTMTVTHSGQIDEEDLANQVEAILRTRLPIHNPDFLAPDEQPKVKVQDRSGLSPIRQQIEEILDRTIRPGLQADGGDIEVISFENDEIKILYQGACGGCPSSMMGTLDAIQGILQTELQNENLRVSPL